MKNLQMLYGIATVLVIVLGIVGCNLIDKDTAPPTSPASSLADVTPIGAGQMANFYVGQGLTDFYGVYVANTSFVVNIPKPGMYLLTYYTRAGFGLTEFALDNLRIKGVPENIVSGLQALVNREFATEAEFLKAIVQQIGNEHALAYESLILRYAGTRSGGPYYLVARVKKNSLLYIGLMPGDVLSDATIDEGDATALATTTPDGQDFGSVSVFFRPGFIGSWTDYFIVNPLIPKVILVSNGAIVINFNVIALQTPSGVTKHSQKYTKPKTQK